MILAAFGELERETICARMKSGAQRAKAQSRPYTREPPYGFHVVEGKIVESPYEQNIINHIASMANKGYSIDEMVSRLLELGFKPRNGGRLFSKSLVWRLATGKSTLTKPKRSVRLEAAREKFLKAG